MKVLRISLLLLMTFSLMSSICYGKTAKEYYGKGIDYGVAGKFKEAQQQFTKALEADPFYVPATSCLKITKDALKQTIKTETALYLFKGIAYVNQGRYDEAIAEFERALGINPNHPVAHMNLAIVYYREGYYTAAIRHCDRAMELGYRPHPGFLELLAPYRKR